ncbi:MAG: hypothetical protein IT425_07175 [Pirellulales bacterium]|nr:hypothetical protein [Pirellulales bacterium]
MFRSPPAELVGDFVCAESPGLDIRQAKTRVKLTRNEPAEMEKTIPRKCRVDAAHRGDYWK